MKLRVFAESLESRRLLSAAFINGVDNDLVVDGNGTQHLAYFDSVSKTLKYSKKPAGGTWSSASVIDNGGGTNTVGNYVSINVDTANVPGVAYYDPTGGDLKYGKFNGSTWDPQVVDSQFTTGYYPSLIFNASNKAIISYYYKSGGNLRLAIQTTSPTTWSVNDIDNTPDDVGRYSSVDIQASTGRWGISYENTTTGEFWYIRQTASGTQRHLVDTSTPTGGGYTSFAFDPDDNIPTFTYCDAGNANLKFARASATDGSGTWSTQTLAGFGTNSSGLYSNLWYQDSGRARLTYYNATGDGLYMIDEDPAAVQPGVFKAPVLFFAAGGSESEAARINEVDFAYTWRDTDTNGVNTLYVNDTSTGKDWTQVTANAGFGSRTEHMSAVFRDPIDNKVKMWVAGGRVGTGTTTYADVWRSENGLTWTQATSAAGFGNRYEAAMVTFNAGSGERMWILGGRDSNGARTDGVYSSSDGLNWTSGLENLPAIYGHSATVMTDPADGVQKIWVVGGRDSAGTAVANVYKSADGLNWTTVTTTAAFGRRANLVLLAYAGKLWVIGGVDENNFGKQDVWYSSNGSTWTQTTGTTGLPTFANGSGMVYDARMWVIAGGSVFYSFNGEDWADALAQTGFGASRVGQTSVVHNDGAGSKMWLIGGRTFNPTTDHNDVWSAF